MAAASLDCVNKDVFAYCIMIYFPLSAGKIDMFAGKISRAATGSSQPPPWRRAAPLRRRPVRSAAGFLPCINRAAIGGPQRCCCSGPLGPSGPQPPGGGGPLLLAVAGALRRLQPEIRICSFYKDFPRPAAAPLAEGCSFASQARPLGCGLFAVYQPRSDWRAAAWGLRRPATRVPQVRFVRFLRRLQPD